MYSNLYEAVRKSSASKARIFHPEDTVFLRDMADCYLITTLLADTANYKNHMSVKWDGSPNLVFGRDARGDFVLTDKSGFAATTYDGKVTTPKALYDLIMGRKVDVDGTREIYAKNMTKIWPLLEAMVPSDFQGFFSGDLLFVKDSGTPVHQFTPNLVTYHVAENSDLYDELTGVVCAIGIHTYTSLSGDVSPVDSLKDALNESGVVKFFWPTYVDASFSVNADKLLDRIHHQSKVIDNTLDSARLSSEKITDLPSMLYRYTNSLAKDGKLSTVTVPNFLDWLTTATVTELKKERLATYVTRRVDVFSSIFRIHDQIRQLKDSILSKLPIMPVDGISATINGIEASEGYVYTHSTIQFKLVNRDVFTVANMNKNV